MKISVLVALMACVGFIGIEGASAQPAFKCPPPGTVVEYSNSQVTTWIGPEGNSCKQAVKMPNGQEFTVFWYAPTAAWAGGIARSWAQQVNPSGLWPLTVGKKVAGRYSGLFTEQSDIERSYQVVYLVEKAERITTKAGTFDTFVILNQIDGIGTSYRSTGRQWYAPDAGIAAKFEFNNSYGDNRSATAVSVRK
jgi:hypothetical protein